MKKTTKSAFHRGFTLIELMIVIVILGILMGTILPRLTGAQARARDTGRIADLNTIAQALETYFDDNGVYPGLSGSEECLAPKANPGVDDGTYEKISSYLKGEQVPTPAASQVNGPCTGAYAYVPLQNKGIPANGFALMTDVETYQKANVILGSDPSDLNWAAAATTRDVSSKLEDDPGVLKTADDTAAGETVYVVYN